MRREIAPPQRHVEGDMLAAREARDRHSERALDHKRQQGDRRGCFIVCDDDAWLQLETLADVALPGREKIIALVRRRNTFRALKALPDRCCRLKIVEYLDAHHARRLRLWRNPLDPAIDGGCRCQGG